MSRSVWKKLLLEPVAFEAAQSEAEAFLVLCSPKLECGITAVTHFNIIAFLYYHWFYLRSRGFNVLSSIHPSWHTV